MAVMYVEYIKAGKMLRIFLLCPYYGSALVASYTYNRVRIPWT